MEVGKDAQDVPLFHRDEPVVGVPPERGLERRGHDVGVGQDRALGDARRAAGELDQGGIVGIEGDAGEPRLGVRRDQLGEVAPSLLQIQVLGGAHAEPRDVVGHPGHDHPLDSRVL